MNILIKWRIFLQSRQSFFDLIDYWKYLRFVKIIFMSQWWNFVSFILTK